MVSSIDSETSKIAILIIPARAHKYMLLRMSLSVWVAGSHASSAPGEIANKSSPWEQNAQFLSDDKLHP